MSSPKIQGTEPPVLILDKTGVGAPVADMFNPKYIRFNSIGSPEAAFANSKVIAITITGGQKPSKVVGGYHVPKRDLVFALLAAFQSGRFKYTDKLPLGKVLVEELLNFKVRIDPKTAHDSYASWREGVHDDIVLSVALATWYGEYKFGRRAQ